MSTPPADALSWTHMQRRPTPPADLPISDLSGLLANPQEELFDLSPAQRVWQGRWEGKCCWVPTPPRPALGVSRVDPEVVPRPFPPLRRPSPTPSHSPPRRVQEAQDVDPALCPPQETPTTRLRQISAGRRTPAPDCVKMADRVSSPHDSVQPIYDVSQTVFGASGRSLSRPLLYDHGLAIVGTDAMSQDDGHTNQVAVMQLSGAEPIELYKVHDIARGNDGGPTHVTDATWLAKDTCVLATGRRLASLRLRGAVCCELVRDSVFTVFNSSQLHIDDIRSISAATHRPWIASGGHDCHIHVVDFSCIDTDLVVGSVASRDCLEVVSSVCWHPSDHNTLSWSTDVGTFESGDVRLPELRTTHSYRGERNRLYCHAYLSPHVVAMGFGDNGLIQLLDTRRLKQPFCSIIIPDQREVGSIQPLPDGHLACFGAPGVSVWRFDPLKCGEEVSLKLAHVPSSASSTLRTSGTPLPDGSRLAVTTSSGFLTFLDSGISTP